MALTAGTRLGPYEIVAPFGAGGMGEVYRAQDARLERTVAFKVLPEHVADDAQRRERRARSENGERLKPPSHLHAPRHRRTGREP